MYSIYRRSLMSSYLTDLWNYLDIASSVGIATTMALLLVYGAGEMYKHFAAVSSIFMWLNFLGVIRALNQKVWHFNLLWNHTNGYSFLVRSLKCVLCILFCPYSQPTQISTFVLMFATILSDAVVFLIVQLCAFLMSGHVFSVRLTGQISSKITCLSWFLLSRLIIFVGELKTYNASVGCFSGQILACYVNYLWDHPFLLLCWHHINMLVCVSLSTWLTRGWTSG